jgi:hypothetical protein
MKILRFTLMLIVVIVVGYYLWDGLRNFIAQPMTVDLKEFNEARKMAVDLKVQENTEWVQLTILLLGFLWIILLAEKAEFEKIKIRYGSEIVLFCIANICYIFSLLANYLWKSRMITAYWDISLVKEKAVEVPDILCNHINFLSEAQFAFFILGIISTVMLFLFVRFLRK